MELIIKIIRVVSDNRVWLLAPVLIVALWVLAVEVGGILSEMD